MEALRLADDPFYLGPPALDPSLGSKIFDLQSVPEHKMDIQSGSAHAQPQAPSRSAHIFGAQRAPYNAHREAHGSSRRVRCQSNPVHVPRHGWQLPRSQSSDWEVNGPFGSAPAATVMDAEPEKVILEEDMMFALEL